MRPLSRPADTARFRLAGLITLAASSIAQGVFAQTGPGQNDSAVGADWEKKPSAADIGRAYPSQALSREINGVAIMRCHVIAKGYISDCVIVGENPAGNGFGEAALKLVSKFKMREKLRDGSSPEGASITIPIVFRLD